MRRVDSIYRTNKLCRTSLEGALVGDSKAKQRSRFDNVLLYDQLLQSRYSAIRSLVNVSTFVRYALVHYCNDESIFLLHARFLS